MSSEQRKLVSLVVTVVLVALVVATVAIIHLYRTALAVERTRLTQTVESQALLIGAVARFDAVYSQDDNAAGATGATVSQIRDAFQHFQWFGETGELLIGRQKGAGIEYLNARRHMLAMDAPASEAQDRPMQLALSGASGTVIDCDYRGERVLAAYAPVPDLSAGLVAKIDMAEINAPYVKAAVIVGIGAVFIALAGLLLIGVTFPLIRQAATAHERERHNLLAIFDSIDEPIHVSDPKTHKLLYVNEAFKKYWGDGVGQPCHQVMNGVDAPCGDCTSPEIFGENVGRTISRAWFNAPTGQWFRCLEKAIQWHDGRLVRYEMAINITAEKQAEQAIQEQQRKVRSLSTQLSLSEEKERKRLATQLHDQIGHALVAAKMKLVKLRSSAPPNTAAELADTIEILEKAIGDIRSLTFELSPPVLHELGLDPALEWLVEQTQNRYGLDASYHGADLPARLDEQVEILLFQATRELLFNVFKHAEASQAWVKLGLDEPNIQVEIGDDGRGFSQDVKTIGYSAAGYGLLNISERMRYLGGELVVRSTPGRGSRVLLRVPAKYAAEVSEPVIQDGSIEGSDRPQRLIRVVIADDHSLMRRGIQSILGGFPDIEIVGEAADGRQALELALEIRPNVVVMDIDMPEVDGIKATQAILKELPETRVLALSMHANRHFVRQMLTAGALGYLLKDSAAEDLHQAIRMVDNRQIFLSPSITGVLVDEFVHKQPAAAGAGVEILSKRELEVVRLIVNGDSSKQVAIELGISQKTAQAHRQNIMKKLGISSTAELVQFAMHEGLVSKA